MTLKDLRLIFQPESTGQPSLTAPRRIAVLMSGGVDSSVTALKLLDEGWEVVGVNMRIPLACGGGNVECQGVTETAKKLHVPLYQIDLSTTFQHEVIDRFEAEYRRGRTPNPCCDCNRRLKFTLVWDAIEQELGINNLATGHYARVIRSAGRALLARGNDNDKDQSYFIYGIPADRLQHFYLPLGDINKDETRALARRAGLSVAEKAESMELCFAGGGDYRQAFSSNETDIEGNFIDTNFKVIGRHKGIKHYTVGQRKLGMSFGPEPSYALRVIPETNEVMIGTRQDAYKQALSAKLISIHQSDKIFPGSTLRGKIRSAGRLTECSITRLEQDNISVTFTQELFAPTPGQHLVLYHTDDTVVAGGTIT